MLIFGLVMILAGVIVNRFQSAEQTLVPIAADENTGYVVEELIPSRDDQDIFREYVSKKFSSRYFTVNPFEGHGPAADAELEVSYWIYRTMLTP